MELSPEERQRIYEEEKARLEAQTQLKAEKAKPSSGATVGCLAIFGVLVILVVIGGLLNDSKTPHESDDSIEAYIMAQEFIKKRRPLVALISHRTPGTKMKSVSLSKMTVRIEYARG